MISVIIVGFNNRGDLKACLDSVYKSTYRRLRVIYVDNGSKDGSIEYVKRAYPKVLTIKNNNSGCPGGNNIGIKKALKLKSDYIFLLNPDAEIDKNCLSTLMNKIDEKTILQPLILIASKTRKTNKINTTGGYLNFLGFCHCSDYLKNKSFAKEQKIVIASGAAVLIPVKILKKIGLLEENFFMYFEDADLFYRANLFGYTVKLIPSALAWHRYSFSANKNKMFYADRNRLLFLYKNFSTKYLILILPISIINELLLIIYSLISGWFWRKLLVYYSALKFMPVIAKERKKNLPYMKKQEKNLKQYIGPKISFAEIQSRFFVPYNLVLRAYWFVIKPLI